MGYIQTELRCQTIMLTSLFAALLRKSFVPNQNDHCFIYFKLTLENLLLVTQYGTLWNIYSKSVDTGCF